MQKKRPSQGRTSLPRCRITGTASVYQRPGKRQHASRFPKENPSEQERGKRQSRTSAASCLNDETTGKAAEARPPASTTERVVKLRKHVLHSRSAFLAQRRSHKARYQKDKRQRYLAQMTACAPAPAAHIPKTPKVCVIPFPLAVRGPYQIT